MDFLLPCSLQCTPNKKFHKKRRTPSTFSTPVSHRYRLFLSFFLFFFFALGVWQRRKKSSLTQDCMRCTYLRIVKQNSTRGLILTVTSWMGSDETSPVPEIEGIARHCSSGCDTCLVGLAELPSPSPPPTSPPPPSRFISQRGRGTCSLSMRSTASLFLSSHCITAVFQHTNNRDCGGSSPLQRCCQPPRCDYMSGNTLTMATITLPFPTSQCQPLLINPWGPQKLPWYMRIHVP